MAYLGIDPKAAYSSYRNIDDISASFDGLVTTFPLRVGGVAPTILPINEQQLLINVGGVPQQPDPSGVNGFKLLAGNIVFSSAPSAGETFWGVILATANYISANTRFANGSASLPSVTFASDVTTGIYSPGAGQLSISTGGTSRLFVDASGRVGIGTTAPSELLSLNNSTSNAAVSIRTGGASFNSVVKFNADDTNYAGIGLENTALVMRCSNSSTPTERARIDSSGRLLVGTSSYDGNARAVVQGNTSSNTTGALVVRYNGTRPLSAGEGIGSIRFESTSQTSSNYHYASISCDTDGASGSDTDIPGRLIFSTTGDGSATPTERMRITSSGGIGFGGGITIGNVLPTSSTAIYIANTVITSGAGTSTLKYNTASGLVTYDTSSRLVKEDIVDCPYGLDAVKLLQPRKYFRTDDQRDEIGFVADELVNVLPEFVPIGPKSVITKSEDDTDNIPLGVNYEKLTAVLTKALQEAAAKIETLEARLTAAGID
jgi:hypothetical protein